MSDESTNVLVVGIDGGTFRVLLPMMQRGLLPNLTGLAEGGVQGQLASTVPPTTAPAWTSFMTGKNPGKHGLFGWQRPIVTEYRKDWVHAGLIRGEKLWHIIGRQGGQVGVINVPMTYPPETVNGFLVSGMLTPSSSKDFVYPPELRDPLDALGYIVDLHIREFERDVKNEKALLDLLADLREVILKREKALVHLWGEGLSDFSMVVFVEPDRIQHYMWGYLTSALSGSGLTEHGEIKRRILECYKEIDRIVGWLLGKAGDDTTVFVISDHGFCGVRRMVHINDWLADLGFLVYRTGKKAIRMWARRPINALKRGIPRAVMYGGRRTFDVLQIVDWSRTKVYLRAFTENAFCINLRGREPQGIVEPGAEYEGLRREIRRLLTDMKDPGDGRPVMKNVWLREELYHGPYLAQAPDVLFELNEGYAASSEPSRGAFLQDASGNGRGDHAPEGMLIAAGAGVKKGEAITGAALIDLAPTILFALGMDIPSDMDGNVLLDVFEPDFLEKRTIRYSASAWDDRADLPKEVYSIEEEADIRAKLQGLGYL